MPDSASRLRHAIVAHALGGRPQDTQELAHALVDYEADVRQRVERKRTISRAAQLTSLGVLTLGVFPAAHYLCKVIDPDTDLLDLLKE